MLIRYTRNATDKQLSKAFIYTQTEHGIDSKKVDCEAVRIISGLHNAGYDAYIVGGAVRDLLIGKHPKDFDIATSAEPARIRKLFKNSRLIGKRFRLRSGLWKGDRSVIRSAPSMKMYGAVILPLMRSITIR